jgi:hypothetical protein
MDFFVEEPVHGSGYIQGRRMKHQASLSSFIPVEPGGILPADHLFHSMLQVLGPFQNQGPLQMIFFFHKRQAGESARWRHISRAGPFLMRERVIAIDPSPVF